METEKGSIQSTQLLKLWLRALTFTNLVEGRVRAALRQEFEVTLPRFDVMAALYEAPEGLRMGQVSRRLMVSNGNVTGIVERLEGEGLVQRQTRSEDRRSQLVRLTWAGCTAFEAMAGAHEEWIARMLSGLGREEAEQLYALLGKAKGSVMQSEEERQR